MKIMDLLQETNKENILTLIKSEYIDKTNLNKIIKRYSEIIDELKEMTPIISKNTPYIITVAYLENIDENFDDSCYEVNAFKKEFLFPEQRFSLSSYKWNELLNSEISNKSIKKYGKEICLSEFLLAITEDGFYEKDIQDFNQKILQRIKDIRENKDNQKRYSIEEAFKEFGIKPRKRTKKEKDDYLKQWKRNFDLIRSMLYTYD